MTDDNKRVLVISKAREGSNREKSRVRVKCEHTISGVKRYNATTAIIRNRIKDDRRALHVNCCRTLEFLLDGSVG
ncbi:MAG: hypothetical protein O4750_12485, partial [Trichodesmium sp. St18_bin3_1_1]|nr:hypothetical protein [Trichodesmium sp. St18_bin3_1_1]